MKCFIVAESAHQAMNTARIDWGWDKGNRFGVVENHKGEKVEYLSDMERLRGLARGQVKIYKGWRWYKNKKLHDLETECKIREWVLTDNPNE